MIKTNVKANEVRELTTKELEQVVGGQIREPRERPR